MSDDTKDKGNKQNESSGGIVGAILNVIKKLLSK